MLRHCARLHFKSGEGFSSFFLSRVSQDGDGLISFGEYMVFITLLAGMSSSVYQAGVTVTPSHSTPSVPRNDIDLAFKVIDVNNDKFVTLPEFQSVRTTRTALSLVEKELQRPLPLSPQLMKTMRQRFRAGRQVRDKSVFGGDLGRLDKGAGMKQLFKTRQFFSVRCSHTKV